MTTSDTVPRPTDAGPGQTAIANTKLAYVNLRTGPATTYRDIGDIRDNSLVVYYPGSRTADDWFYVAYRGLVGWVAGSVTQFEATVGQIEDRIETPFDGKVAVWYWKGDGIAESSIEEFAQNLKFRAPNVQQVWVKTSDGASWMGEFDRSAMAIDGPADVDRWVETLKRYDLEFCAWCVPQGKLIEEEAEIIAAVCNRPGVQAMILDVEPYVGFWQGGQEAVRPFMLAIKGQITNASFHIGLSVDPRPQHYNSIFPEEWFPFVGSLHPQSYWKTFRTTPEETLQSVYETWTSYGRPIIPVLQGDAEQIDQIAAHVLATNRHGAPGISWWRYGVISQFGAVNLVVEQQEPENPVNDEPTGGYAEQVIVTPRGDGFRSGSYTGRQEFSEFESVWGWTVLYKGTQERTSAVWAEWKTELPESGRYEISVFVPSRHATTQRARYKVHGIKGTTTEVVLDINQSVNRNRWVPLGIFDLVKGQPNAGKVFLNDVTGEADKEIAFDAVRFRRLVVASGDNDDDTAGTLGEDIITVINGIPIADGFDSPVGTEEQRRGDEVWPSDWKDASPFAQLYFVGTPSEAYHTGADLNWGIANQDLGRDVYATANGVVTFAARLPIWGNVIVIRHDPLYAPDGMVVYSRYAHVQNMKVKAGERVVRGQEITEVGNAFGSFTAHLHFDISPTTVLETRPSDWPGTNQAALLKNYVDPQKFIQKYRP